MRLGYAILLTIAVTGFGCDQTARESSAEMEEAAEAEAAVRAQKPKPVIVRTPMTITSAKSSCMCTVPKGLEGSVIPPGGSHPFSMTFTTSDAPGAKDAKVWVYFEAGGEAQHLMVRIEADVALVVRSEPPYVDALNGVASGTVRIESTDGKPFSILSTYGGDPVFADGFDPQVDDARTAYTLQWDVAFPTMSGCDNAKLWWVVETDHPDCPVLPLRIRHDCTGLRADADHQQRGWIFREYLANLGSVKAGVPVEVEVDLRRLPSLQRGCSPRAPFVSPPTAASRGWCTRWSSSARRPVTRTWRSWPESRARSFRPGGARSS
jgi:hypothetical protein